MNDYQTVLFAVGLAGLFGFLLFGAYSLLRPAPPRTRRAVKVAVVFNLVFFLCMTGTVFAQGEDSPLSGVRYLPWIISGVPIALTLGYIAHRQANAMLNVMGRPRLRLVLESATLVLLLDWFATAVAGLLLPREPGSPSLYPQNDDTSLLAILERVPLLGVELFYMCIIGAVFLEASGPRTPSRTLRLRNFAFFSGVACWTLTEAIEMSFPLTGYLLSAPSAAFLYAILTLSQALLLCLSIVFWLYGFVKHQYRTDVDDWFMQVLEWSRLRELLGLARAKARFLSGQPLATHEHHLTVAAKSLGVDERELRKAVATVQMTCVLSPPQNRKLRTTHDLSVRQQDLLKCAVLQERLIQKQTLFGPFRLSSDLGGGRAIYELEHDIVYESLRPTLWLTKVPLRPDFPRCPQWLQLAAVAAAHAGLIDSNSRDCILESKVIDQKALAAYSLSMRSSSKERFRSLPTRVL